MVHSIPMYLFLIGTLFGESKIDMVVFKSHLAFSFVLHNFQFWLSYTKLPNNPKKKTTTTCSSSILILRPK